MKFECVRVATLGGKVKTLIGFCDIYLPDVDMMIYGMELKKSERGLTTDFPKKATIGKIDGANLRYPTVMIKDETNRKMFLLNVAREAEAFIASGKADKVAGPKGTVIKKENKFQSKPRYGSVGSGTNYHSVRSHYTPRPILRSTKGFR